MLVPFSKSYKALDPEIFKYKNEPQVVGDIRGKQPPIKDLEYDPLALRHHLWTESGLEYIRQNWKDLSDQEMSKRLFRTKRGVAAQRILLGLKRKRVWE